MGAPSIHKQMQSTKLRNTIRVLNLSLPMILLRSTYTFPLLFGLWRTLHFCLLSTQGKVRLKAAATPGPCPHSKSWSVHRWAILR